MALSSPLFCYTLPTLPQHRFVDCYVHLFTFTLIFLSTLSIFAPICLPYRLVPHQTHYFQFVRTHQVVIKTGQTGSPLCVHIKITFIRDSSVGQTVRAHYSPSSCTVDCKELSTRREAHRLPSSPLVVFSGEPPIQWWQLPHRRWTGLLYPRRVHPDPDRHHQSHPLRGWTASCI
jgi:hypothetical protein